MIQHFRRRIFALVLAITVIFPASVTAAENWLDVSALLAPQGTPIDFTPHGTQPGLAWSLEDPEGCAGCHRGYTPGQRDYFPHNSWSGSMMANAMRDPIFWAALDVANKDVPGVGDYCLRCHTPPGWFGGRVQKDGDGGSVGPSGPNGCALVGKYDRPDYKNNDYAGVTCHFCHRMMPNGPNGEPTLIGNANAWIDNATSCTNPDGSSYGGPCRRGPYTYSNGLLEPPHGWTKSAFHETSELCASCHDVSTPDTSAGPLKTLILEGGVTTTRPMPIERTYSEWKQSTFADVIFRNGFDSTLTGTPAIAKSQTCQSCHMRISQAPTAKVCQQNPNGSRTGNLPVHEFAGANAWVPQIIKSLYGGPDGLDRETDYDRTTALAREMLMSGALTETSITAYTAPTASVAGSMTVRVKVTNLSGHKLPTGYAEGRRMWLNVKIRDNNNAVVAESAVYDPVTGILTEDAQAKVYETLQGIWDTTPPASCRTEVAGKKQFHFVLNNCIAKDNRIPPLGFRPKSLGDPNGDELRPVAYSYPETSPGSGALVNYDVTDYTFTLPANTPRPIRVDARLNFQISSKEYIEFLRDQALIAPVTPAENTLCTGGPNRPFDVGPQGQSRGAFMFQLWSDPGYGKSPPEITGNASSASTPN
ncbi:MAG: hypothetical protein ABIP56_06425 [Dokdonella sp.]